MLPPPTAAAAATAAAANANTAANAAANAAASAAATVDFRPSVKGERATSKSLIRTAVTAVVKEYLAGPYMDRRITKDDYKTIAQKAVEKVVLAIPSSGKGAVPNTQEAGSYTRRILVPGLATCSYSPHPPPWPGHLLTLAAFSPWPGHLLRLRRILLLGLATRSLYSPTWLCVHGVPVYPRTLAASSSLAWPLVPFSA